MKTLDYRDKSWLKQKYFDEEMSLIAIARYSGVCPETIRRWAVDVHRLRLRTRTRAREVRLRGHRKARAEELLRSVFQEPADDLDFDQVQQELEDERIFKDSPELLRQLRERRAKESQSIMDSERRRDQARRLEQREGSEVIDYTVDDEMAAIQTKLERSSKSK